MPPRISARHASLLTASLLVAACSEQHPGDDTPATDAPVATDAPTVDAGVEIADAATALDAPPAIVDAGESDADLDAYYYPDGVRG